MKWLLLMTAVVALAGSGGLTYLGWLHNPQGEFFEQNQIHWLHVATCVSVNFLVIWLVASLPVLWFFLHSRYVLKRGRGR